MPLQYSLAPYVSIATFFLLKAVLPPPSDFLSLAPQI